MPSDPGLGAGYSKATAVSARAIISQGPTCESSDAMACGMVRIPPTIEAVQSPEAEKLRIPSTTSKTAQSSEPKDPTTGEKTETNLKPKPRTADADELRVEPVFLGLSQVGSRQSGGTEVTSAMPTDALGPNRSKGH